MNIQLPDWLICTRRITGLNCKDIYSQSLGKKLGSTKKFLPYKKIQSEVRKLGIKNQPEYIKNKKPNWPYYPRKVYKKEWVDWPTFTGTNFLSYEQLVKEVREAEITACYDYDERRKPNWPSNPRQYYKEWQGWDSLFGRNKAKKPSKDQLSKMAQKKSTVKIAKEFNVASSTIHKWLKSYKIKVKPMGYWQGIEAKAKKPSKSKLLKMMREKSMKKIAKELGVSGYTVAKWAQDYKIKTPPKGHWITKHKKPPKKEISKLMDEKSMTKIAEQYGVSSETVKNWAEFYKIKTKPRGYFLKK